MLTTNVMLSEAKHRAQITMHRSKNIDFSLCLNRTRAVVAVVTFLSFLLTSCTPTANKNQITYAATIHPLAAILRELTQGRAEIVELMSPGASPHTYEPRPSDASNAESSIALFYVSENLDAWASHLPAKLRVSIIDLIPKEMKRTMFSDDSDAHGTDNTDPHFWSDPVLVKALVPPLLDRLTKLDPEGATTYRANAQRFETDLDKLNSELQTRMAPLAHRTVVTFHPSWNYFFARYNIVVVGTVEPSPGKESSPQYIEKLANIVRSSHARAVFTEPQLPRRPAEIIAETANVPLHELDPLGGSPGRQTYREIITYNASRLEEALK